MEETQVLTRKDLSPIPIQGLGKVGMELAAIESALEVCDPGSIDEDHWAQKIKNLNYEKSVLAPALASQIKNRETFIKAAKTALKDRLDYLGRLSMTTERMKSVLKETVKPGEKYDNEWVSVRTRKTSHIEIDSKLTIKGLEELKLFDLIKTKITKDFDKIAMTNALKRGEKMPNEIKIVEDYSVNIK